MMENALIEIEKHLPQDIFKAGGCDQILAAIREKVSEHEPDIETTRGRKEIASLASRVSRSKTLLDGMGKSLKAEYKAKIDPIDAERKKVRDTCDQIRDEVRKPLTDYEDEQKRIEAEKIAKEELEAENAEKKRLGDIFNREEAVRLKEEELAAQEAERKAKDLADQQEKERIKREAQIKKDAEDKAIADAKEKILEAERKTAQAKQDAEQAELKRLADIETAKAKAEQDKQDALAAQKREQEEAAQAEANRLAEEKRKADRKAANLNHKKAVNDRVFKKLAAVTSEEVANAIMVDLINNPIPEITINYQ